MSESSCEELINRPTFREVHTPTIVFFLNVPFCISSFFRLTVLLTRLDEELFVVNPPEDFSLSTNVIGGEIESNRENGAR